MIRVRNGTAPGSSPLTRGKHICELVTPALRGLIPAHAGKTERARRWVAAHRAHPRSRGENDMSVRACHMRAGSSPLTRGKRGAWHVTRDGTGLIPAHAGKTINT